MAKSEETVTFVALCRQGRGEGVIPSLFLCMCFYYTVNFVREVEKAFFFNVVTFHQNYAAAKVGSLKKKAKKENIHVN